MGLILAYHTLQLLSIMMTISVHSFDCRIPYEPLPERSIISGANFDKQPPENLRKCSFFSFSLTLYDANKEPIEVESASFLTFIEVTEVSS